MKVAVLLRKFHFQLLPAPQKVCKLHQSGCCDGGVRALLSPFEVVGLLDFVFVVLGPDFIRTAPDTGQRECGSSPCKGY